eukprot:CAMPEP_0118633768 /NCGR_PEP_ID=MMETSP0785-20121206/1177_1 /TAXON_ID=91992 /ORGANISM="Bolidomonas pacifica, Strain CCMP 1866" /LENGTH=297 /DNA_ID=CAMNT_0006524673 /DNA_START=119 /DNA_END=1008 /DNA_ORIENTATION=-
MPAAASSFPRGGARKPSDDVSPKATSTSKSDGDFLFSSNASSTTASAKKRRKVDKTVQSMIQASTRHLMGGGNVKHDERTSTIEGIGFSRLEKGMKVLGVVNQVFSDDIVSVSMPNGIVGFVTRKDKTTPSLSISLPISTMTTFTVLTVSPTEKRVELSPMPTHCNRGLTLDQISPGQVIRANIEGEEDHGWTVDLGMAGVKAFLPKKLYVGNGKIIRGMFVDVKVVKTARDSRMVTVSNDLPPASTLTSQPNHVDPSCNNFSIKGLRPGMLVQCDIDGFARNGIMVSFLGGFKGCV